MAWTPVTVPLDGPFLTGSLISVLSASELVHFAAVDFSFFVSLPLVLFTNFPSVSMQVTQSLVALIALLRWLLMCFEAYVSVLATVVT